MDLPSELCFEIFSYLPVHPLMKFRVVSKATVEYAKRFKGSRLRIKSLQKWHACFPEATQANISGLQLCMDDVPYLAQVKDLDMSLCCPYLDDRFMTSSLNWFRLPGLKKLTIMGNDQMTDEWLSQFTELEELSINRSNQYITGSGFRAMTKLKRLTLISMSRLRDEALMGLPIEELTIVSNRRITDDGIEQLTNLKILYLYCVKYVTGHGYEHLPLKQILISDVDVDRELFQSFANVPKVTFSQCHFMDSDFDLLTKLEYLTLYECTFEESEPMTKLLDLKDFKEVHLVRCPLLDPSVQEKMGPKLKLTHRKKWP
jgi:hypothetical protein